MKKPVIILVALIYIISIVIVGFIGIQARVFNPVVFVNDLNVNFDENLVKIDSPAEGVDYAYRIFANSEVTFTVTANVLPNDATNKRCVFEKRDESSSYTFETQFNGEYTIASFKCEAAPADGVYSLRMKVKPTDGNKSLFKVFDIFVYNF
ncbi:MAG: hypothetical protein KBS97_02220 [Firmicutes bacterium]|nr:hypothetical protein [Candidatus Fiminaster equi]